MTGTGIAATVSRFTEADDFAGALLGGRFEVLPPSGTPFAATHRVLRLGDLVVQQADIGAHTSHGALDAGLAGLILPLRYPRLPARMNGADVARGEAFLAPGGVQFWNQVPTGASWAALAVPIAVMARWAELAPLPVRQGGEGSLLLLPEEPAARLLAALDSAAGMAEDVPPPLDDPGCVQALAASFGELVADVLTDGVASLPQPRAVREARRVVMAAEDYLRAARGRPIFRDELCGALGVSLRKLHGAFMAIVGMSPPAYLKRRRLALARRALRAASGRPALVKSVALAHGFWHLGYFARDYKALFGEAPSATLGRGRSPGGACDAVEAA